MRTWLLKGDIGKNNDQTCLFQWLKTCSAQKKLFEHEVDIPRDLANVNALKITCLKILSEHDQEIPQSQTADKPMAPRGRPTQQSPDIRKTN